MSPSPYAGRLLAAGVRRRMDDFSSMHIVAYYTPDYASDARHLQASCRNVVLDAKIFLLPDAGSWLKNVHLRPKFLAEKLHEIPAGDILVSLDVDCVVHRDFSGDAAFSAEFDVACHFLRGKPLPGTLLLRNTGATMRLLQSWHAINQDSPQYPDRTNFHSAIQSMLNLRVQNLPPSLCWIVGISRGCYPVPPRGPAIEHLQASRDRRMDVRSSRPLKEFRRRRLAELGVGR
jgi:hypothetical protein